MHNKKFEKIRGTDSAKDRVIRREDSGFRIGDRRSEFGSGVADIVEVSAEDGDQSTLYITTSQVTER